MRKETSVASMISVISTDDGVDASVVWSRLNWVLWEIGSATVVMAVDVLPRLSINEGKLVWCKADNGAVTVVEFFDTSS